MNRVPSAMVLPPPPLAAPGTVQGWQAWRQRRICMGPECAERDGLRVWYRWPGRMQLQQGWCCGPDCLQAAMELQARRLLRHSAPRPPRPHRIPLGLLLLSHGLITPPQLRAALAAQQQQGGRVGEWLVRQGAVSEDAIASGVALQWARPTFPLAETRAWQQCRGWVPLPLLEELGMLPLYFAPTRRRLYVGFTQVVDATAVAALQQMLECKPVPCIVADSAWMAVMEEMRAMPSREGLETVNFTDVEGPAEIAGITRQYARYAGARQVRVAVAGPFLWVRIRGQRVMHLSFRPKTR
ncbi:MAG: hypothetical protein ACRD1Y_07615 [Terriglobales bacterium]